ncbi:MAG: hypothetical protein MJZ20_12335 [Bacteroidaceae bacterium]|nr:hypothetical protein [Bacteroidaceae bacterium]
MSEIPISCHITAEEARELANKVQSELHFETCNLIYKAVRKACAKGETSIIWEFGTTMPMEVVQKVCKVLKENGFVVPDLSNLSKKDGRITITIDW